MTWRVGFALLAFAYVLMVLPFSNHLENRPIEVKLGYLPHAQVLELTSGEHQTTIAEFAVLRVLFYFGTIIQKLKENVIVRPEFMNMYKTLETAIHLDPYNLDAYYFAQASFTWDLGRVKEVNHLLKRGVEYRSWDPWLPFYVGFNYAYFLEDYEQAGHYMQEAAERSGNPLFTKLAARYFYEAQQSNFGLAFLETMIMEAKSETIRQTYQMRYDALQAVVKLEDALNIYQAQYGRLPQNLQELVKADILPQVPDDPYGGEFYLDKDGKIRSSSMFTISKQDSSR